MLRVSAKLDYALRALVELARARPDPVKADALAREQQLPRRYLEATLAELRVGGFVRARRGADGGYWLAMAPEDITIAAVTRALDGALIDVRAVPIDDHDDVADALAVIWECAHRALAGVLDNVTLADVIAGRLPEVSDVQP